MSEPLDRSGIHHSSHKWRQARQTRLARSTTDRSGTHATICCSSSAMDRRSWRVASQTCPSTSTCAPRCLMCGRTAMGHGGWAWGARRDTLRSREPPGNDCHDNSSRKFTRSAKTYLRGRRATVKESGKQHAFAVLQTGVKVSMSVHENTRERVGVRASGTTRMRREPETEEGASERTRERARASQRGEGGSGSDSMRLTPAADAAVIMTHSIAPSSCIRGMPRAALYQLTEYPRCSE